MLPETLHKLFAKHFSVGSELRKSKVENLFMKYKLVIQILSHTMTEQQKCTQTSLYILWTLAKDMKPFTDVNIVKECILNAVNVLFENKRDVVKSFQHILISTLTNTRKTIVLAEDYHKLLIFFL